jgi:hypothetical protein
MPQYKALRDTLIAHECRIVREGDVFTTEFPGVNGKPMALGGNLELVDEPPAEQKPAKRKPASTDLA